MPSMNIFDTIRDSILMGVHHYNYKNGAFTSQIFKETPVVDALNILISSGETTAQQKSTLKAIRKVYIDFRNRGLAQPQLEDDLHVAEECLAFGDLFTDDVKSRGMYVPPNTFQTLNADGTVAETVVLNKDGTQSVFEGGVAGVPPGAPDEFVKAQAEKNKKFGDAAKDTTAQVIIGNNFRPETVPSAPKKTRTTSSTSKTNGNAGKSPRKKDGNTDFGTAFSENLRGTSLGSKAENKKPSKKDDNMDFGKAFSKNLRGAFM